MSDLLLHESFVLLSKVLESFVFQRSVTLCTYAFTYLDVKPSSSRALDHRFWSPDDYSSSSVCGSPPAILYRFGNILNDMVLKGLIFSLQLVFAINLRKKKESVRVFKCHIDPTQRPPGWVSTSRDPLTFPAENLIIHRVSRNYFLVS